MLPRRRSSTRPARPSLATSAPSTLRCVLESALLPLCALALTLLHGVQVAFIAIFIFFFASTWGPGAWVLIGEIFPLPIRSRGVALSTASNWLWNTIIAVITPYMVGSGASFSRSQLVLGSTLSPSPPTSLETGARTPRLTSFSLLQTAATSVRASSSSGAVCARARSSTPTSSCPRPRASRSSRSTSSL